MRWSDILALVALGMFAGIAIAGTLTYWIDGTKPVGVGLTMVFVVVPLMGASCFASLRETKN